MGAMLSFESRQSCHVLRQDGAVENAPYISLLLTLIDGPTMYSSDAAIINKSAWNMKIQKRCAGDFSSPHAIGSIQYLTNKDRPRCLIDIQQSAERFNELLEMFKGGHVSEIKIMVDQLADKPDYSKNWNTAVHDSIPVTSLSFEFPLPQSEA
ncbi:MAG: hypothetical protein M3Y65_18745 [Pseudomonadota bacterium]|nr:hypothetical protein [Pseudomonadota bacterium]